MECGLSQKATSRKMSRFSLAKQGAAMIRNIFQFKTFTIRSLTSVLFILRPVMKFPFGLLVRTFAQNKLRQSISPSPGGPPIPDGIQREYKRVILFGPQHSPRGFGFTNSFTDQGITHLNLIHWSPTAETRHEKLLNSYP